MVKNETNKTQLPSAVVHSRKRMIKGNTVRQNPPRKVEIKAPPVSQDDSSRGDTVVEPLMENGLVVGVNYHCRCGENTEIRFELEKSTPDEIIEQ